MKLHKIPQSWLDYAAQHRNPYQTWLRKLNAHIQFGQHKWEVDVSLAVPGVTELCMLASDTHYDVFESMNWIIDEIAQELEEAGGSHEP